MGESVITVFDNINGEIRRKNISQEKFCEEIGINRRRYFDWQLNNDMPLSFFIKTAQFFGCSLDYLMRDVQPTKGGDVS